MITTVSIPLSGEKVSKTKAFLPEYLQPVASALLSISHSNEAPHSNISIWVDKAALIRY